MNEACRPNDMLQGHSLHYLIGKGDWKYKKEWLDEARFWSQGSQGICRRCFARAGNWSDFVWMQDWHPTDESALDSAFGPIPLPDCHMC